MAGRPVSGIMNVKYELFQSIHLKMQKQLNNRTCCSQPDVLQEKQALNQKERILVDLLNF